MSKGLLLDSHVLIWSLYEPGKVTGVHADLLKGETASWISIATV